MTHVISRELKDALDDLNTEISDVLSSCLWDSSIPGCDCGCGGDTFDYEAARADEEAFLNFLPELLKRVRDAMPRLATREADSAEHTRRAEG